MSKSSSNDDINIAYLDKLTEAVVDMTVKLDKISSSYGSNGQLEQTIRKLAQEVNNGSMSLKQMLKEAATTQKDIRSVEYGLEDTTKYNKTVNMFLKLLEERMGDSKIDEVLVEKITTAFENLDVSAILESEKIEQKGGKGAPLKNTLDNEKLGRVNEDLARRIGLSLDTTTDKLITFFQEQEKKKEKKERGFVDDLIEGLEKSKWVGGALHDTFRLIGLLGANWLSKFGQLGRILGGAFYVAMATAGPLLVKLLLQGIGKLFTALPRMLGNLGKGLWGGAVRLSTSMGGPLSMFTPGRWGMMSGAGKAASVGRLAGAGAVAGALGTGAFFAGRESYRSFKQGDKVGGSAFGVGAAGLGVAAIAAIIAGVAAPVTLIAAAVGGIAVGVGAIWKNREKIVKFLSEHKGILDKILKFLGILFPGFKLVEKLLDHIINKDTQGQMGENATTGNYQSFGRKGTTSQLLEGKHKSAFNKHLDPTKMTEEDWQTADTLKPIYGKMGEIVNLGKMSQKRASEVIAEDIRKKGNKSFYEFVGTDLADPNSFGTDAKAADNSGVYLARGMSAKFKDLKERLEKAGFDTSNIKITSGIGTLGSRDQMSPHAYTDSINGHFSSLATTIDTSRIYNRATGKRLSQDDLRAVGLGDYWLNSEGDHEHIAMKMLAWQKEALEKAKVTEASTKSMDISQVIKNLPEEDKRALGKKLEKVHTKDPVSLAKEEEKILKDLGIYKSDQLQGSPWVRKNKDGTESLLKDASGNIMFTSDYMQSIANKGV